MKRVMVIGNPGAGKTTFARKLRAKTKLPLYHLDTFYHDQTFDYPNKDRETWFEKVRDLAKKDKWIIEGNYSTTFPERLARADTVLFLDFSTSVSMWRVLKRRIQYRNKVRPEMPAGWKEKLDPIFIMFVINFRRDGRKKIIDALHASKHQNVIVFTNNKQTRAFLKNL